MSPSDNRMVHSRSMRSTRAWVCAAGSLIITLSFSGTGLAAPPAELVPDSQFARLGYVDFGRAVAARADVVLAASRPADPLSINYGGGNWVDAFRGNGEDWIDEAGLIALGGDSSNDDIYDSDDFDAVLALSPTDQTAFVGAPEHDGQGRDSGAVFVFRPLHGSWYQAGELHFAGQPHQHFGSAIAAGGNPLRVVVGAPGSTVEDQVGAVFVYDVCSGLAPPFCLTDSLEAPVDAGRDFGVAVATDGNWLAVGAPWAADPDTERLGAVYLYKFKNEYEKWVLWQVLRPDPAFDVRIFGSALAIGGPQASYLAVGAPAESSDGYRLSTIHLFHRDGDQWTFTQRLAAPSYLSDPPTGFVSFDFSEQILAVGEPMRPSPLGPFGMVRAYRWESGQCWLATSIRLPDETLHADRFGMSVAIAGNRIYAGAPGGTGLELLGGVFAVNVPTLGDANADGDADLADAALLVDRLEGPGIIPNSFDPINVDYDADGDVDLFDAAVFQRAIKPLP